MTHISPPPPTRFERLVLLLESIGGFVPRAIAWVIDVTKPTRAVLGPYLLIFSMMQIYAVARNDFDDERFGNAALTVGLGCCLVVVWAINLACCRAVAQAKASYADRFMAMIADDHNLEINVNQLTQLSPDARELLERLRNEQEKATTINVGLNGKGNRND